jgi:hypothetical protein
VNTGKRTECLVAALVGFVAFLPFVRGTLSGASLYFRDLSLYFLPLRRFALEALRAGHVPFWNPYLHEGEPLSLPALGYPLDLLQLLRPDESGLSLVLVLHVPLAAIGFFLLARRLLGAPSVAAVGGALVYSLGGFLLSTVNLYVYLQAAAWAPFLVLLLARVAAGAGRGAFVGAAVVTAIALSTTGVEIAGQALLLALVLGTRRGAGVTASRLGRAGAAVLLGAALAAPALALVVSQVAGSARGAGLTVDVVLAHSVHPFSLVQSVVGGLYGRLDNLAGEWWGQNFFPRGFPYVLSLYLGPAVLAVAFTGLTSRHPLRTRLALLAAAGLVVCLGRWAGLAPLVAALPPLRLFRYPVKAFFIVHTTVAMLATLGLERLAAERDRRAWRALLAGGGALGLLLALAPLLPRIAPAAMARFAAAFFPPGYPPDQRVALLSRVLLDAATGGAVAVAVAGTAALAGRGLVPPPRAAVLVVALVGADLLRTGAGLNPMVSGAFFRPSSELARHLAAWGSGRVFTCPFDQSPMYQRVRLAKGTAREAWTFAVAQETLTPATNVPRRVPTAMSIDLTMLVPEERVLLPTEARCDDLATLVPRLRRAGVDTVLSLEPLAHPDLAPRGELRPRRIAPLVVHVYAVSSALPRARVATHVRPVGDAPQGTAAAAEPGFLDSGGAAVEGAAATKGARGRVERERFAGDMVELEVDADRPTVVVVRDGWAPGWTARVNGGSAPVFRADGRHRAIPIPAGRSEITLRYRPRGLDASIGLAGLGLLGLGLLARRSPPSDVDGTPTRC